jgi:hypothetical protein
MGSGGSGLHHTDLKLDPLACIFHTHKTRSRATLPPSLPCPPSLSEFYLDEAVPVLDRVHLTLNGSPDPLLRKSTSTSWGLSYLEVRDEATGQVHVLVHNGIVEYESPAILRPLDDARHVYQVTVVTGNDKGAGTNSEVSLVLEGEKAISQEFQ